MATTTLTRIFVELSEVCPGLLPREQVIHGMLAQCQLLLRRATIEGSLPQGLVTDINDALQQTVESPALSDPGGWACGDSVTLALDHASRDGDGKLHSLFKGDAVKLVQWFPDAGTWLCDCVGTFLEIPRQSLTR